MPLIGEIRKGYKASDHRHIWNACPHCGKERWVVLNRGKPKYQLCAQCTTHIGSKNPHWKGGRSKQPSGYILILAPNHPKAHNNYVREHVIVWEQAHGKTVPEGWIIHHLNGIKDDNRPRNLVAMPKGKHSFALHLEALKQRIRELEVENKLLEKALDNSQMIFKVFEN